MADEIVEEAPWAQDGDEYQVDGNTGVIHNSDNAQQDINNLSSSVALQTSGDSASPNDGASEDVGDYDPESVDLTPVPQQEQVQSRQSSLKPLPQPAAQPLPVPKKRKTAGGFLVGDSDSEDDNPTSNGLATQSGQDTQPLSQSSPPQTSVPVHDEAQEAVSNVPSASQANNAPAVSGGTIAAPLQDVVTTLEERIKQDPRAAMDSWLDLIAELRRRNDIDALRGVYERFLAVFPQSADIWTAYMEMELGMNNFGKAEELFKKTLTTIQNVNLLTVYLNYIRRRNDISDPSGRARDIITQSFEFVLSNDVIGVDKDSGPIWTEYIQFIKTGPGVVGDQDWESKKKMDLLRRVYQRAIAIPTRNLNTLWREYEQFENSIDRKLGRALVSQHSPSYMSAKSANMALDNMTRRLQRGNLPRLPPAPGFDGDEEYMDQVELWKKWIAWEKSDPLELKADEPNTLNCRILYVYRQALMALRFWPEMWVEAAEWCWENDIGGVESRDRGLDFLLEGIEANPENVLLALKHGDRVEGTYPVGEGDAAKVDRGNAVRAPYLKVLDTLYELIKKFKEEEKAAIDRINQNAQLESQAPTEEDDEDAYSGDAAAKDAAKQAQIKAIQQGYSVRTNGLSKTISYVWIALARAMRRIQGTGAPQVALGGLRNVFWEARQRGKLASDVYVAVALMEWKVYRDNAGAKIFERGAKLFPEDEYFMVEYLKFLHSRDDFTNARVVFENCVKRLTEKPNTTHKAKMIFSYFHKFESDYGDRSQIVKLEQRMAELFPDDPKLKTFAARFSSQNFDPIAARIIISPSQMRPKNILPSIEQRASVVNSPRPSVRQGNSPRPQFMPMTNSPKRPHPADDFEDLNPPRKIQRGESPLKGAAGRRLDQQRRVQAAPIARDITFLLGLLPPSSSYTMPRFKASEMVRLVSNTYVPEAKDWKGPDKGGRGDFSRLQVATHTRQASSDRSQYPYSRDSPITGRTQSPFDMSRGRIATAASTYQQSSLRPGSSSGYEQPLVSYRQDPPPPMAYPQAVPTPDANGAWPPPQPSMYGGPPPSDYTIPSPYGQAPPPQQPPYSRYY
ncbi:hypothetical protein M406DRAFT_292694 [Cryphonectria parasitica EP155]|uniref:mRNA 3'-end-processing protein RNA14 n=1 Tax=Cryphonectria parasitica (strain ATCC 38755 / EP155) TaxID=660469 RepID=A0A9P5CMA7_CRYP1|nr:uncharacterized protein M406DRAFT_292694 [Cryphonectria parasitica EP155]KAF3763067.1 hypothetical protein M406DRAFT_292694 [Cryphonectria parasitica EP155]